MSNCKRSKRIVATNGLISHRAIKLVGFDESVRTYDLSSILHEFSLKSVDFLKLDVEGSEFAFVLNEPDDVVGRVRQWAIEIHTCGLFCDVMKEYMYTMAIVDKFSRMGYCCVLEKLHPETCCYMIYARQSDSK